MFAVATDEPCFVRGLGVEAHEFFRCAGNIDKLNHKLVGV